MTHFYGPTPRRSNSRYRTAASPANSSGGLPGRAARRQLRLERLEARRLLATLTVDVDSDVVDFTDGRTTLREAVYAANVLPGDDTIIFDPTLSGGTIHLNGSEIPIVAGLTIDASGLDERITVDAGGQSRIFNIDDPTSLDEQFDVRLDSLVVRGGRTTGNNDPEEPLGRRDLNSGGGIRFVTSGHLSVFNSHIVDNHTEDTATAGGGIYVKPVGVSRSQVTLENTILLDNSSGAQSGGGLYAWNSTTVIRHSQFQGNRAQRHGGAINTHGSLVIEHSQIYDNHAEAGRGGGIAAWSGAEISFSQIADNSVTGSKGAGIYAAFELSVVHSTISGNQVKEIETSRGGGIFFYGGFSQRAPGSLSLQQVTISDNSALGSGGGIYVDLAFATP